MGADILDRLRGQLIVSCQPVVGGPMDRPDIVAAFAAAALAGGAAGLRIEGVENLRAVRAVTGAPVIGLVKVDLADSPVRITPLADHVAALIAAGADIVAVDATDRRRPEALDDLLAAIRSGGVLAMADCAEAADGHRAADMGFDILGSTLSGYTGGPASDDPDLPLVSALADVGRFVVAEGRYRTPSEAAAALRAGADAVVAGSAITRPEHVTEWFIRAMSATAAEAAR